MCCCRVHVESRNFVNGLLQLAVKNNINLPFSDHSSFYSFFYLSCKMSEQSNTYIPFECTANKNHLCDEIKKTMGCF